MGSWLSANQFTIQTIAVYALLGFSIQVPMRAGTFSLAGIGFYGVGSYTAAIMVKHGYGTLPAIALGMVISGIAGWILARLLVRLKDLYLAMATLAFDLTVGVIALNWTNLTGGATGLYSIPVRVSTSTMLWTVLVVALALTVLESGIIGRVFEASREDEQLARSLSVDTAVYRRFAFVVSAVLGSLAGAYHSLSAFSINANEAGFDLVILVLAMVIIGGFTSWVGAVAGAIILVYVPIELSSLGDSWPIVYGCGLLLFAVYVPKGIYGTARSIFLQLRSRTVRAKKPTPATTGEPVKVR